MTRFFTLLQPTVHALRQHRRLLLLLTLLLSAVVLASLRLSWAQPSKPYDPHIAMEDAAIAQQRASVQLPSGMASELPELASTPYAALWQAYQDYKQADGDTDILRALYKRPEVVGSYLQYRLADQLAHSDAPASERAGYYEAIFSLQVDEPLDRSGRAALSYDYGSVLESLGNAELAIRYYREALPSQAAQRALERLAASKFRLANYYLQARMYRQALATLDGEMVPSITAPAERRLGNYRAALRAYEAWLAEEPGNISANFGKAWSLYYLERDAEADALFARYPNDGEALYARALIARRAGEQERAIQLLRKSGRGYDAWRAAQYLDDAGRDREALSSYIRLAEAGSSYADDAAYRAITLARQLGDVTIEAQAKAYLPARSYFRVLLGESIAPNLEDTLDVPTPSLLALTQALAAQGDTEAAIGELRFALRSAYEARNTAEVVALGQALQRLGDFRQSQRYAERLVNAGSSQRQVWQLAYPLAYPQEVRSQAARVGIPPQLIWAIMFQESRFYPRAVSSANAKGLMQFIPSTWDWMAELLGETPADPFTPADSIRYGATYLAWLINYFDAYGGSLDLVVPSYNGGQGYIKRLFEGGEVGTDFSEYYHRIDKTETREYLERVMRAYHIYEALYDL